MRAKTAVQPRQGIGFGLRTRSIQFKLVGVVFIGLAIAIALATFLVSNAIGQFESRVSEAQLIEENHLADIHFAQQEEALLRTAGSIGVEEVLGTALVREDETTLKPIAATFAVQHDLDQFLAVNADNETIYELSAGGSSVLSDQLDQALNRQETTALISTPEGWLMTAAVPVVDPVGVIGAVLIGQILDDERLHEINIGRDTPVLHLHGPDGSVVASSTGANSGIPLDLSLWQGAMDDDVSQLDELNGEISNRILYAPLKMNDEIVAVYSIELSNEAIRSLDQQLNYQTILVLIGIGLLIALILYFLMRHFITRPLVALGEAAKEIGAGNLDAPLPPAGDDEIGQLTASFGSMVDQLQESFARVEERSTSLQASNLQLGKRNRGA